MTRRKLYHWTHRSNLRSIRRRGLDPSYALGNKKTVWACEEEMIGWALCHVSARHGHSPDEYVLIELKPLPSKLRKTCWKHVYTCDAGYPPERIASIRRGLLAVPTPLSAA